MRVYYYYVVVGRSGWGGDRCCGWGLGAKGGGRGNNIMLCLREAGWVVEVGEEVVEVY